ncbi:hypothetical protein QBC35DRAFT_481256 [Podospora australis]|uniref:Uncharacterized protein n=1 Tax=Podospora australis TaxID=1536484 RepID=A0AAN6X4Q6_9PEZI|nr:hypothetical protein QBC35DRAFT_481256 [Podospora australis]
MAWWDSTQRDGRQDGSFLPSLRDTMILGNAIPQMGHIPHITSPNTRAMERERALLSPVFEHHNTGGPPNTPSLVVHVEILFTDPVIRSRYTRSYGSSQTLDASSRICRGLVRRIERCCEELITRKDSSALEALRDGGLERKPSRFEMNFRIMRRSKGEWAERTYRSYQKQPLTIGFTREVILATHRMIGLFLRRHDENFKWLDYPDVDSEIDVAGLEDSQTTDTSSSDGPVSLSCIPNFRFNEFTQTFDFVPGYSVELSFRSRYPLRRISVFQKSVKINSNQASPLTLFTSEDLLWKGTQAINQELDSRKRALDARSSRPSDGQHWCDDALEIELRIVNHLGPTYSHVHKEIKSNLVLFHDPDSRDCTDFFHQLQTCLAGLRDDTDAKINDLEDLDIRIRELKGVGWTRKDAARFTIGSSVSYGQRTIQAALDRIQTGIGDVIRGHDIAIHITAHKRDHLVVDKAIVAHEKRGRPKEIFGSPSEAESAFISRLQARVQQDIDRVFEDSCSIDDLPDDEEGAEEPAVVVRPSTPSYFERPLSDPVEGIYSPAKDLLPLAQSSPSVEKDVPASPIKLSSPLPTVQSPAIQSPSKQVKTPSSRFKGSPRRLVKRVLSLGRRSTDSVKTINNLKPTENPFVGNNYMPSSPAPSIVGPNVGAGEKSAIEDRASTGVEVKVPKRSFSLVGKRSWSALRALRSSNTTTLMEVDENPSARRSGSSRSRSSVELAMTNSNSAPSEKYAASVASETRSIGHDLAVMTSEDVGMRSDTRSVRSVHAVASPLHADGGFRSNSVHPQADNVSLQNDDRKKASSAATTKGKMDSPSVFEDARESAPSPGVEDILKSETESSFTRGATPGFDQYSTAPSTPDLSSGDSSPRHSLLITPVYVRSGSGARDPLLRNFNPESEDTGMDAAPEIAESDCKDFARPATEAFLPAPGMPVDQHAAQSSGPTPESDLSLKPAPRIQPTRPHNTTNNTNNNNNNNNNNNSSGPEKSKSNITNSLGAEKVAGSDCSPAVVPDFPTQVRKNGSNPAAPTNEHSQHSETASGPNTKADKPLNRLGADDINGSRDTNGEDVSQGTERASARSNIDLEFPDVTVREHLTQNGGSAQVTEKIHLKSNIELEFPDVTVQEDLKQVNGSVRVPEKTAAGSNIELEYPEATVQKHLEPSHGSLVATEIAHTGSNIDFEFSETDVQRHLEKGNGFVTKTESCRSGSNIEFEFSEISVQKHLRENHSPGSCAEEIDPEPKGGVSVGSADTAAEKKPGAAFTDEIAVNSAEPIAVSTPSADDRPTKDAAGPVEPAQNVGAVKNVLNGAEIKPKTADVPLNQVPDRFEESPLGLELAAAEAEHNGALKDPVPSKATEKTDGDVEAVDAQQLASELEVQVDNGVKQSSATESTPAEPVEVGRSPEDIVDRELANELEVQLSPESEGTNGTVLCKIENGDVTTRPAAAAAEGDILYGAGRKGEIREEDPSSVQPAVPPAISVEDLTTIQDESQTPAKTGPPRLAPVPDISRLLPHPNRNSTSTLSSTSTYSDASSFTTTVRGSVDTFRPSFDELLASRGSVDTFRPSIDERQRVRLSSSSSADDDEEYVPRPQTAGYLGLHESPFKGMGLRGALGDRRRCSLPLQHLLDEDQLNKLGAAAPAPASEAGSSRSKLKKHRRAKSAKVVAQPQSEEGAGASAMFPKVMMLFAGAMALSKIVNRSS